MGEKSVQIKKTAPVMGRSKISNAFQAPNLNQLPKACIKAEAVLD